MQFGTGKYLIRNAYLGNLAILRDDSDATDLTANVHGLHDNTKGEKWSLVLLSTKPVDRYKIQNDHFGKYASCEDRPREGASVQGKAAARLWIIKRANRSGQYTISIGKDPELYWGLVDEEHGTLVELFANGNDPHNQWTFERINDLEECVHNMAGDSRSMCLEALTIFPSLASNQLDKAIQDGGLMTAIRLLSHSDISIRSTASTATKCSYEAERRIVAHCQCSPFAPAAAWSLAKMQTAELSFTPQPPLACRGWKIPCLLFAGSF